MNEDVLSVCWTGLRDLEAYSLLGGGIPIPEQRVSRSLDSVPLFSLLCFPVKRWFWSATLPPLQDSSGFLAQCSLSVSSLFYTYCLLSILFCLFGRPPPAASGHPSSVRRKSPSLRLTSDQIPFSWFPIQSPV